MQTESTAVACADLTAFKRDVLALLAREGPCKGTALKAELEDCYETTIHHGRLYPNLTQLNDEGLLTKKEVDGRTNHYNLTPRAERELRAYADWLVNCLGANDV